MVQWRRHERKSTSDIEPGDLPMPTPPLLDLPAGPYERGRRHGAAMAGLIRDNVETYLDRFASGGLARDTALALGEEWGPRIERYHAAYHEEMRGVAEGSDLPLATIAMLNARYELIYGVFGTEAQGAPDRGIGQEPDGCTSFGLMPEATRERITMIGQNWDWLARIVGHTFVMRVRRTDEPSFVGFTEAGIVGCKMGVQRARHRALRERARERSRRAEPVREAVSRALQGGSRRAHAG
jgi:isopenicillin-N N-acyltransferase like protein